MQHRQNIRVLIAAEHASARFGGEAFLPLHYFRVLRDRGIEAFLISHERVKAELREAFPEHEQHRFHFVTDNAAHRFLWRIGKAVPARVSTVTSGAVSHLVTQLEQRRLVRRLVRELRIDVVHEPIPVSPKQPSALFDVGAPVVIGPMNGAMDFPPGFRYMESRFERLTVRAARGLSSVLNRAIPGKRQAAILVVANERTRLALPASVRHVKIAELVENGVDLSRFRPRVHDSTGTTDAISRPVRFVFVGRLVDWKAVDLLLAAFARAKPRMSATLEIFGDGPERPRLQTLAGELELGADVIWHAFVPQQELALRVRDCDVLVLPSLYECGGAVVLEAMAAGLCVIATRWGGPADYLDPSCAILIDPTDRDSFIRGLADSMVKLATDPALRTRLAAAALDKVTSQYDWERKVDRMLELYEGAIEDAMRRPARS
jgi:glycosyltransferase involved in cell wall biosynthesis